MQKFHLPTRTGRGGRWLALGVAAAVVAVPGVAYADAGSDLVPGVSSGSLSGAASGVIGQAPGTDVSGSGLLPGSESQGNTETGATDTGTATTSSSSSSSPLDQIKAALEQAGVSAKCSDAVQGDLTQLLTDIPGSVQAIVATLVGQVEGGQPPSPADITKALQDLLNGKLPSGSTSSDTTSASDTPSTSPDAIATDLQKLVTDFVANCIPAPPTLPSTPTTPSSPSTGQGTQTDTQPVAQPETARPVSYPGYAATGSIATTALRPAGDQRPDDAVPLSVLGGVVLVSAAAAVGARARVRRGAR